LSEPRAATETTIACNHAVEMQLPFSDRDDFDDARRGFVGTLSPALVRGTGDRVVWDLESYAFLDAECPATANPSLWRQSQLNLIHGLFEVTDGIYQVRGLDLSNMTLVEGERGVVVIDPLICSETAAAALALYREHRGNRPVTGVIYTHSHVDHFGGVKGVVDSADVAAGRVPVLAPEGFMQHAISENVYAGTAMSRRAVYMYGALLEKGPAAQIGAGLGQTNSTGTVTLIAPTLDIVRTGQEETIDGVRMLFQLTPGTEAPAEMNFFFPDHRAFCAAENATHNLHNVLTLRGAVVRDAHTWSSYLDEALAMFGAETDVLFAQHHWPRWGRERVGVFLRKQRDLYGYLHDQTVRLMNQGWVGSEIAEVLELPPALAQEWHCRGYYGSVSHNVKAIYQRYMGWFDGNPAHLWQHPPVDAAVRYVEFMGGADAVMAKARASFEAGDYRWVAEVVSHVVFADPDHRAARELEADALEQLGYQAESGPWRNFYLMGARELREGIGDPPVSTASPDIAASLTVEQLWDAIAVRVNGPAAWDLELAINWEFTDTGEQYALTLEHGVLSHRRGSRPDADASVALPRDVLDALLLGAMAPADAAASERVAITGDAAKLAELFAVLDQPDPNFAIVTP